MKFKVREDLTVGETYGKQDFTTRMAENRGQIIEGEMKSCGDIYFEGFLYTPEMLEPVEDVKATKSFLVTKLKQHNFDPVNKPQHYADRKYEVIDVIEDSVSSERFKGFLHGNVIKYILRYEKKGGVQDLKKAEYYLKKLIGVEE